MAAELEVEEILSDALELLGAQRLPNDLDVVHFGPLALRVAPKEGAATSLLADQLFSPALLLAHQIQTDALPTSLRDCAVLELGSGAGLPSILAKTRAGSQLVVASDYPADTILKPLKTNVSAYAPGVLVEGFAWGSDPSCLLYHSRKHSPDGFDVIILSDLLHFASSHDELLDSVVALLRRTPNSSSPSSDHRKNTIVTPTVYVACGTYTPADVCRRFVAGATARGLRLDEQPQLTKWHPRAEWWLEGLTREDMGIRLAQCRLWIGQWAA
ncbi:hypothetical protein BKA62DRAFT_620533 [Auriculariales sp. MPI-PUGE-AT-0066]|nr:hypothetical protein BKA62DRAFT_620533 [Auriculariales sp. MPI-PUGE-AT-0066]